MSKGVIYIMTRDKEVVWSNYRRVASVLDCFERLGCFVCPRQTPQYFRDHYATVLLCQGGYVALRYSVPIGQLLNQCFLDPSGGAEIQTEQTNDNCLDSEQADGIDDEGFPLAFKVLCTHNTKDDAQYLMYKARDVGSDRQPFT